MNRCWDTNTMMTSSIKLYPHPCFVYAAQYHPGSPHLVVTGGYDHLIRIWTKLSDGLNGKVKWLHWQTVHDRDVDNNLRRVTLKTPPSRWLIYTVLLVLIRNIRILTLTLRKPLHQHSDMDCVLWLSVWAWSWKGPSLNLKTALPLTMVTTSLQFIETSFTVTFKSPFQSTLT